VLPTLHRSGHPDTQLGHEHEPSNMSGAVSLHVVWGIREGRPESGSPFSMT